MAKVTVAQLAEQVSALTELLAAQQGGQPAQAQETETEEKVTRLAPTMFIRDASDKRICSPVFEPSGQETYIRFVPVDADGALKHQKANPDKLAGVRIGASMLAALLDNETFIENVRESSRHPNTVEVPSA